MFDQKDIDRFWSKVKIKGPDDCWLWLASGPYRYGRFWYKGKYYNSNVFAFMITNDIILSGYDIIIRHKCNNSFCCNPNHLIEGTQKDNIQDSIKAGTHFCLRNKRENNPLSILTEKEIKRIFKLKKLLTVKQMYNLPEFKNKISISTIYKILNGLRWKYIK